MYTDQQYGHQGYGEEGWFGELIAAPLDHRYHEAVSHDAAALASATAEAVDGGLSTGWNATAAGALLSLVSSIM
jgi:hypothetical protein